MRSARFAVKFFQSRLVCECCFVFFISLVTAPMNSRPGTLAKALTISKACVCKLMFWKALATLAESFEVNGSASLKRLATSTTVKAYLYVFRPRPRPTVSCRRQKRSAWRFAQTHRWGEECVFGAGRYICQRAWLISPLFWHHFRELYDGGDAFPVALRAVVSFWKFLVHPILIYSSNFWFFVTNRKLQLANNSQIRQNRGERHENSKEKEHCHAPVAHFHAQGLPFPGKRNNVSRLNRDNRSRKCGHPADL